MGGCITNEDSERRYAQLEGERDYYKRLLATRDEQIEHLQKTERLAKVFAKAKGRYHSQHAMCDLMSHFGMPCVRPGEDAEMVACACGEQFPIDSYGAGFMAANGGVCQNCAMMGGV